ncbi:RNA 2',3'-cyclic phosphodiesterase [Candidatus Nitronereus thalassa]|uniref:RNA 2',3'-cyclic phosphodiesterase n=1 Tax=Candidatus Nitronereus thalassa TaxID=3020898 RepID=A0ABU3K3U7_9BACT|nr:RNA 2',3'-cyclic phosphodiesterase [Candidatus Nitronereus thalassa]MDT7041082.1 RNA 2',3'-cyclic phosphodiesterase [Candidatus Nitronereus thalassa]
MSLRTFLAIDLPSSLHLAIEQKQNQLKSVLPGINWVKSDNLHITLKFLGDTPESQIDDLRQIVEQAVKGTLSFVLTLRGFGAFPDKRAPRTLWTGIESEENVLEHLAAQVEAAVVSLGFPEEGKPFRPHLTLARIKKDHRELGQAIEKAGVLADPFIFGRLLVEQVTLFQSDLRPTGSVYTKLWAVPLAKS